MTKQRPALPPIDVTVRVSKQCYYTTPGWSFLPASWQLAISQIPGCYAPSNASPWVVSCRVTERPISIAATRHDAVMRALDKLCTHAAKHGQSVTQTLNSLRADAPTRFAAYPWETDSND